MSGAVLEATVAKPRSRKKVTVDKWWEKAVIAPSALPTARSKIMQTIMFNLGSFNDEDRTFTAIASTPVVDRQGDIVDQASWDLDNFKANPVIPWAHDYQHPPVARAIEVGVVNGVLKFTYQAPPAGMYEFADLIWNFYRNQYMFAFSVGFIPAEQDGNTFSDCELLEISAVVVPANPQALALAYKSGDMDIRHAKQLKGKLQSTISNLEEIIDLSKTLDDSQTEEEATEEAKLHQDAADKLMKLIEGAVEKAMSKKEEAAVQTKGAISSDLPLADKETAWSKGTAVAAVKKWASDAEGNIDFSKYKKAFMWVDSAGGDKQGDYKLPFATVQDDKLVAVWNAVKAIMGILNGARGGVTIPDADRKAVYTQVKKYYKKFGEEVPDLKSIEDIDTGQKGAVADELAEEQVVELKRQNMCQVLDVFWAFCDVYFDEETDVDAFGDLLKETADLFQSIADSGTGGDGAGLVISTMRGIHADNAQESLAQFFTKMLTGETLEKDNRLMGKKDMGEGSDGGSALVPVEFAGKVKAVQDYLLETKAMLDKHTEALRGHAGTMNAHADALAEQAKAAEPHAYILKNLVDVVSNRTGDGGKANDPDGDGISDSDHLDNNGGNNALDEQNYPDSDLTRLSGKPSETKAATEAKGEVKSEDTPTDGADPTDEVAPAESEAGEGKEAEAAAEQPAVETPTEETPEETPAEGKATTEATFTEAPTEEAAAEEEAPAEAPALTDETEVDENNLSDEEAEEIVRAVNEALAEAKKK